MTNSEAKAISIRAAIDKRAARLRRFERQTEATQAVRAMSIRALKTQIRDLELELAALPLE